MVNAKKLKKMGFRCPSLKRNMLIYYLRSCGYKYDAIANEATVKKLSGGKKLTRQRVEQICRWAEKVLDEYYGT